MRGALGVSKAIRLVVLQPCPGGRAALLCLEHSERGSSGASPAVPTAAGISMAVVVTAFTTILFLLHLLRSFLPSHHLFASIKAADVGPHPSHAEGVGNTEVPGRGGRRGVDRSEGCC